MLPVLGSDILAPIAQPAANAQPGGVLFCRIKGAEFPSPSAAAVVVHGGSANGLIAWKTGDGKSLKQLDERT